MWRLHQMNWHVEMLILRKNGIIIISVQHKKCLFVGKSYNIYLCHYLKWRVYMFPILLMFHGETKYISLVPFWGHCHCYGTIYLWHNIVNIITSKRCLSNKPSVLQLYSTSSPIHDNVFCTVPDDIIMDQWTDWLPYPPSN